ncbi:NTP transferase domain-containing protein [Mesorhizobium sp. NBSH29]|uniref:NTP transferase domain-containing protein n=1 Tax=Mesorhizobium sp. NBSH29 TaxID=2654249 RepID=UPI00189689D3|nr:molybdopterin-binding/glycosyltransferase family 2 protein [Mesorhizobium sp. NBSH29]QPC87887.1 NTP transferase domain-containing protein [Mesorhizobium sp. NBSH29]
MKFGPVTLDFAEGAILAHATLVDGKRLRKAHVLTADDVAALRAAGQESVIAAVLEAGDVVEDRAAERIALCLSARNIDARPAATGRVNLHARTAGLYRVDGELIKAVNAVDPSVTVATLAHASVVEAGTMVATVKIIPFAVPDDVLAAVERACAHKTAYWVDAFASLKVGLIQTTLPGTKQTVLDKTTRVTEARLAVSGSTIVAERRTAHQTDAVAEAVHDLLRRCDLLIIFGASAVSDIDDVVPAAIRAAGGRIDRLGMPVDPGNLLVLATCDGKRVIGAPGCARSPKENGFDWVLNRLFSGNGVDTDDLAGMGVGGLLMEIPTRPQPREIHTVPPPQKVFAVVLAAGQSRRMGGPNKLLARFDGQPLIERIVERVDASGVAGIVVVTGHQADKIANLLPASARLQIAHNAAFAEGLAGSLQSGIAALPEDATGALITLGDMPAVSLADIDRLVAAFVSAGGTAVVRATHHGKRGNPVILPRAVFPAVARLKGDTGARHLIENEELPVIDVEIGAAASLDVDTPDAMRLAGGVLER